MRDLAALKEMVGTGKKVRFAYYRAGSLWYRTENDFFFPVPIEDVGEATFLAEDKAILFMRYIRRYMSDMEEGT